MRRRLRVAPLVLGLLLLGAGMAEPALPTTDGAPVTAEGLRTMLEVYVPRRHSSILIFTQNYGGDFISEFTDRPRTVAMAANGPGLHSYYSGFHDDAARALFPAEGRTSQDIFAQGVAGRDPKETPLSTGTAVSFAPVTEAGTIRGRRVLFYASEPTVLDISDFITIKALLENEPNTTVTLVSGPLPAEFNNEFTVGVKPDYPATLLGLASAIWAAGTTMGEHDQLVLFVAGNGARFALSEPFNLAPMGSTGSYHGATVGLNPEEIERLMADTGDSAPVKLFGLLPGVAVAPEMGELEITIDFISDIPISEVGMFDMPGPPSGPPPPMGGFATFELTPEGIVEWTDADGQFTIWVFNRGTNEYEDARVGLLLPPVAMEGVDDLLGTVQVGPASPTGFRYSPGTQGLFQFVVTNASSSEPFAVDALDFDVSPQFEVESMNELILGYYLYKDTDGDGEVSVDDVLLGPATQAESGSFSVLLEPGQLVIPPNESQLLLLGVDFGD